MADIIDVNIGDQVLEVFWQDEVELNLDMDLMYIKSGQKEIQDYVDNVSKPEIDNYIETEANPIVTKVVNTIAEPLVNEYIEGTVKPDIDTYTNEKLEEFNTNAASLTTAYATNAATLVAEYNANATEKTDAFNTNASEKQAMVDASVAAATAQAGIATEQATAAANSATAASNYASNASADADNAAESAGLAANSAAAAATSEANAKTSETNAAATKAEVEAIAELASFGNVGDIKYTSRTDVPNGGAWCDGALYTKAQFPDVYQMLVDGKLQSTTISAFDSTVSANGSCSFFGLDTANECFKVPMLKNVYLKAGQAGEMFGAESLPNITGSVSNGAYSAFWYKNTASGAFNLDTAGNVANTATQAGGFKNFTLDASRSSSTYQDGAKVNPEHVTYRAYVVLYTAKDVSSDTSTEYQLNNPFSLLDYKWSEYELNNASWLLSNGAFHSGATYPSVYELLLKIKNGTETKDGVSVKLSTEAYTDFDFVLNTADTTFRLPIKVKLASGNAVAGNGMTLGMTNGTQNGGLSYVPGAYMGAYTDTYGSNVQTTTPTTTAVLGRVGITTDPTKSGIETSSQGLKLYFYVGETIQDANVINAAGVLTDVANLKGYDYVVESYQNGTDWYRIYKSGWVEQGGIADHGSVAYDWNQIVTLLKEFKNTNYIVLTDCLYGSGGGQMSYHGQKTTSNFTIYQSSKTNAAGRSRYVNWYACGQGE